MSLKEGERDTWPANHRPCTTCGEMKPFDAFHKHAACWMGVNTVCKVCRHPLSKKNYHAKSKEQKIWEGSKSRAHARGIEFSIEVSDIEIPEACPILGIPIIEGDHQTAPSLDRIDPSKGYIKGNVWVISNKANMMKSNATKEELLKFAEWVQACEIQW